MDKKIIKALIHCFELPPEKAVEYLKSQGIEITWDWKAQLEAIRNHSFTVAKVETADMLQMFHDELVKAANDGTTYQDFKKQINDILDTKGYNTRADGSAWRLDTIYRTNLQSAYMAGRYNQMKDVEEEFPYWQYIAVMDSRTRPSHAALNGKVVRADDPFWSTHYPPNGYLCRCRVRALDAEQVKAMKLKVVKGTTLQQYQPDAGFDINPAEEWVPDISQYETSIRKQLKKALQQ